jgi:diguanylate cyclase (GGDEF)-like protein
MEFAFGLPLTVAFATVAVIGYWVGRYLRPRPAPSEATRRELKRAQAIIQDLEKIAHRVRRELALHHSSLATFKNRVDELSHQADSADWRLLCDEAERLLKPTQDLAMQLAHAYDGIRQQGSQLTTFAGQRCDPLTGLCNRQALDETIENFLTMHRRYGMLFSVAIFDLDNFKQFNEEHGHAHGDRLLKQVASLLDGQARDTDVVTRSGGEEFMIVLPTTELPGATNFAERIRYSIERSTSLTVSAGVAAVVDGDDAKTLLTRADSALYAAKAAGRNRVYCHNGDDAFPSQSQDLLAEPAAEPTAPKAATTGRAELPTTPITATTPKAATSGPRELPATLKIATSDRAELDVE